MQEVKINPAAEKARFIERYPADVSNNNDELIFLYSRLSEMEQTYGTDSRILQGKTLELYKKHLQ
jgi:hypothetical protein